MGGIDFVDLADRDDVSDATVSSAKQVRLFEPFEFSVSYPSVMVICNNFAGIGSLTVVLFKKLIKKLIKSMDFIHSVHGHWAATGT